MSFYDAFKDAISVAQKADNVELYRKLLDLSAQALELQAEINRLTEENEKLKKNIDIESKIVRHEQPFVTLDGGNENIRYCSTCWAKNRTLIQVRCNDDGHFRCPECQTSGIYDRSHYYNLLLYDM